MIAYFDDKVKGNLIYDVFRVPINTEAWTFPFDPQSPIFREAGFVSSFDRSFSEKGIYYVSVKKHADFWSGLTDKDQDTEGPVPRHILEFFNPLIIRLMQLRKLVVVIDNQAEGNSLHRNGFDAYEKFHIIMRRLRLPQYSVVFMDSNKEFVTNYENWCAVCRTTPMIAHSYALTGFYYFQYENNVPTKPLILDAIQNEKSADFSSLNRTARLHRLEHLYYLIKNNLYTNNLVSGYATNRDDGVQLDKAESALLSVNSEDFCRTLNETLPLRIDGNWETQNPDDDVTTLFNHSIYKNSLLSFVTETEFADTGLFITEKTFKPIVAGHPFIILGQLGSLEYTRELGYKVDFHGIDSSYDKIKNPRERFFAVHTELRKWINLPRQEKINNLMKSMDMIEYNLELYKTKNYRLDSYINLRKTIEDIFAGNYRTFNVTHKI
jgi:hypothetical protein